MKPLPVTAIFGDSSSARDELIRSLLNLSSSHLGMRFGDTCDGRAISEALSRIAAVAEQGACDHLVLEMEANADALMLARWFESLDPNGVRFSETAHLTGVVTAVDTGHFLRAFLPDRSAGEARAAFVNELADQLEVSDFLVVRQSGDHADGELAQSMARSLNPRAVVTESPNIEMLKKMLSGKYDARVALRKSGWQQLMNGQGGFEDPAWGIRVFVFEARRPFHPQPLWDLLDGPLPGVFRAKGIFWLATRMPHILGIARTGSENLFAGAGRWWASIDRRQWPSAPDFHAQIEQKWVEPYGDRQQAIVFMGAGVDFNELQRSFEACLMDESEMADESTWSYLADPFPRWDSHSHAHEAHDHAGHHHGGHDHTRHEHCCGGH
jgi:G3E family GTPase